MKEFLSIREVAALVGVDYKTIYALVKRGELPAAMIGGQFRIKKTDFEDYFQRQKAALQKESEKIKNPRLCATCGKVLVSVLSVRGHCDVCERSICNDCWDIAGMRSCQEHREQRESETLPSILLSMPAAMEDMLQCGLCGRGISGERFVGGHCEGEGCEVRLCRTCWQDDYRACRKHLLTNDQKLEQAKAALAQDKLSVLVEAEMARAIEENFIARFEMKVQTLQGRRNPFDGKPLRLGVPALNWQRESEKDKLPRLFKRKPMHPALFARVPLNQTLRVKIPLRRGIIRKEQTQLIVVAQCHAHLTAYMHDGFDTEPVKRSELLPLLEQYVEEGRQRHVHYILGLMSPSGWTPDASELVFNPHTPSKSFSNEWLAPCLITPNPFALTWNPLDDHLEPFIDVFRPELAREEIERVITYVRAELVGRNSLSLAEVSAALGVDPVHVKRAFEKLAANEDFMMDRFEDFGLVLSRKGLS